METLIPFNLHLPSIALGMIATTTATVIVLLFEQVRFLRRKDK